MKGIIRLIMLVTLAVSLVLPVEAGAVSASAYCVMDSITGRVLYQSNADQQMGMASTTKIVTAIVALEHANLQDIATVSAKAANTEGSSLYLKAGEKITVENLIYGLMLNSGNDAAVVLAEHIGGSVEGFAALMNELAERVGAKDSHFQNPNGLDEEGHYTTAYDLALLTRYALKNETFQTIVSTKSRKITTQDGRAIYLSNHNRLLGSLKGCNGVKTGFTKKTGRCLVSSVTRDGFQTICVTLNAPDDWNDHKGLHEKAFGEYAMRKVVSEHQFVASIDVSDGVTDTLRTVTDGAAYLPAKEGEVLDLETVYELPQTIAAPVSEGQPIGRIKLYYHDALVADLGVLAENSIEKEEKISYFDNLKIVLKNWLQLTWK